MHAIKSSVESIGRLWPNGMPPLEEEEEAKVEEEAKAEETKAEEPAAKV